MNTMLQFGSLSAGPAQGYIGLWGELDMGPIVMFRTSTPTVFQQKCGGIWGWGRSLKQSRIIGYYFLRCDYGHTEAQIENFSLWSVQNKLYKFFKILKSFNLLMLKPSKSGLGSMSRGLVCICLGPALVIHKLKPEHWGNSSLVMSLRSTAIQCVVKL